MHVFPVETDRLRMRPMAAADAALYEHLYTDAETMRFIGAPLAPERAARSFRIALAGMQREPIERLFLTVIEKSSQTDVGICSLQDFDTVNRSVQGGIMFIQSARAQGYCKEGFGGLVHHVFTHLPVDELWVQFAIDHVAVHRTVLGLGFARRGSEAAADGACQRNGQEDGQGNAWSVRRDSWSPPPAFRNVR
ncbi:acetyltransferase [Steroidobacter agaridevorans]|nr:acetyltransferase [Steroidobacter agaridevorans]